MAVLSPETLMSVLGIDEKDLDCAGQKLHLDKVFRFLSSGYIGREKKLLPQYEEVSPVDGVYRLGPGAYKVRYREIVRVPPNAIALAIPRSTLLRSGVMLFTAVWDPGYFGRGEGLLVVYNPHGVEIEVGAQIAQLVYISMDRATSKLYRGTYLGENIGST